MALGSSPQTWCGSLGSLDPTWVPPGLQDCNDPKSWWQVGSDGIILPGKVIYLKTLVRMVLSVTYAHGSGKETKKVNIFSWRCLCLEMYVEVHTSYSTAQLFIRVKRLILMVKQDSEGQDAPKRFITKVLRFRMTKPDIYNFF